MAEITSALVKELRERTGAGMMDCKNALVAAQGDIEKAIDSLAVAGAKKAKNSASRVAAQGVVMASVSADHLRATIVEINCETDFVAKDTTFKDFANKVSQIILSNNINTVDALLQAPYVDQMSVEQAREGLVSKLGENIQIRRLEVVNAPQGGCVASYIHGERIAVLIALNKEDALARDLAMQVAAMRPLYIDMKDIPEEMVAREKAILVERAKDSDKPAPMLEKILEGQLKKVLNEWCLLGQSFIKNPNETVASLLQKNNLTVLSMLRFEVGEGIVQEKKNFLEEVMEQVNKI